MLNNEQEFSKGKIDQSESLNFKSSEENSSKPSFMKKTNCENNFTIQNSFQQPLMVVPHFRYFLPYPSPYSQKQSYQYLVYPRNAFYDFRFNRNIPYSYPYMPPPQRFYTNPQTNQPFYPHLQFRININTEKQDSHVQISNNEKIENNEKSNLCKNEHQNNQSNLTHPNQIDIIDYEKNDIPQNKIEVNQNQNLTENEDLENDSLKYLGKPVQQNCLKKLSLKKVCYRILADSGDIDVKSKIKYFSKLFISLKGIFIDGNFDEAMFETLSIFQKQILYYFIKRKFTPRFLKGFEKDDNSINYKKIRQMIVSEFPRRPEECYKFILTRLIKHLKKKIESEYETHKPEEKLYHMYFNHVAVDLGLPISEFFYPLAGKQVKTEYLNRKYFTRIFRSEAFVKEIELFCQYEIFQDFNKEFEIKVMRMLERWEGLLIKNPAKVDEIKQSILNYVVFHKRCKLPWTLTDVKLAIEKMKILISNLGI